MRILSTFLMASLAFGSAASAAQLADTPQVAKIKAQVEKRGVVGKSKVRVTLENGTLIKGYVNKIDDSSFDVNSNTAGQTISISYADVRKIQGPGLSRGAKIGIGVVVAVAIVAAVAGIIYARTPHGVTVPVI